MAWMLHTDHTLVTKEICVYNQLTNSVEQKLPYMVTLLSQSKTFHCHSAVTEAN